LRDAEHKGASEIHSALLGRDVGASQRTVTNLLGRDDELLAAALGDGRWLKELLAGQGRVLLALDGFQPDVGHEVLWAPRDCLLGEGPLAGSLPSARQESRIADDGPFDFEHLDERHRILKPGGLPRLRAPVFGSPRHLIDPTHVRGFHPRTSTTSSGAGNCT
jgi:hypothetical protein